MRTLTYNAAMVVQALASGVGYGFEVMGVTGLPAGTVYPILRRLEASGLLTSRWEADKERAGDGRPRRRYYAVTPSGREALSEARERIRRQRGLFDASHA